MLIEIIGVLIIIAVIFGIIAAIQPDEIHVTRTATMTAAPEKVFAQVNDLHAWDNWSPWAKIDPNAKPVFEGSASGTGAIMRWSSKNMQVGEGSMTIIESRPNELVRLKLDFLKPMKGTNIGEFAFKPEGNQTIVTWIMTGKKNFAAKAMGLVFNCEKMIGSQFDKGLAQMKAVVEGGGR